MNPEAHCRNKAAPVGSSPYYALLYIPEPIRRYAQALLAFVAEVSEIPQECQETAVAHLKLQWWQDELERTFQGQPRHPVSQALREVCEERQLPLESFLEYLQGMQAQMNDARYPSLTELSQHCYQSGSIPTVLLTRVLGFSQPQTLRFGHALGMALRQIQIIHNLRKEHVRGRLPLAEDRLAAHGIMPHELQERHTTEPLRRLLKEHAQQAREQRNRALALLPEADRWPQLANLVLINLAATTLDEIERDGYRVLEQRIELTPTRKLWIAWRTARRERRRLRRTHRGVA